MEKVGGGFVWGGGGVGAGVVAHGVDACEVGRIAAILSRHRGRLLERVFTEAEAAYAGGNAKLEAERLAARFAAKEAVMKALGVGWAAGVGWREIGVVREASGRPGLAVVGAAGELAARLGVSGWLVSLTHTRSVAIASVIGVGGGRAAE